VLLPDGSPAPEGKNKGLFKVIKFKTMNNRKDVNDILLPDGDRLTGVDQFVRKTSFLLLVDYVQQTI